jgi:hypothetical protein
LTTHIFLTLKTKLMKKEKMIEIILAYHKELKDNYKECVDAFGQLDKDTQRAITKLFVIEELLEQLNLAV